MSFCCECCALSGRGLCDGLITRSEESYRLWCVVECDLETSRKRRPWPTGGCRAKRRKIKNTTRQAMDCKRNTEELSRNSFFCLAKAVSITYCKRLSLSP